MTGTFRRADQRSRVWDIFKPSAGGRNKPHDPNQDFPLLVLPPQSWGDRQSSWLIINPGCSTAEPPQERRKDKKGLERQMLSKLHLCRMGLSTGQKQHYLLAFKHFPTTHLMQLHHVNKLDICLIWNHLCFAQDASKSLREVRGLNETPIFLSQPFEHPLQSCLSKCMMPAAVIRYRRKLMSVCFFKLISVLP